MSSPNLTLEVAGGGWPGGQPAVVWPVHIAVGILMTLVAVFGVIGNGLVILVFTCFRSLRNPMNLMLVNLAVSDLVMSGLGSPMVAVASFYGYWPYGSVMCQVYAFVMGLSGLSSIGTMAVIAVDRVCAVVKYRLNPLLRSVGVSRLAVVVWVYSAVWTTPPLAGWSRYTEESFGTACSFDYLSRTAETRSFLLCLFVGGFVVPCIVIFSSYAVLWVKVIWHERAFHRQAARMDTSIDLLRRNSQSNIELRITKVCGMVLLVYLVAWLPYATVTLVGAFGNGAPVPPLACMIPGVFAKCAAVYNPLIYSLSHPQFKNRLRRIMCHGFFNDSTAPSRTVAYTAHNPGCSRSSSRGLPSGRRATFKGLEVVPQVTVTISGCLQDTNTMVPTAESSIQDDQEAVLLPNGNGVHKEDQKSQPSDLESAHKPEESALLDK